MIEMEYVKHCGLRPFAQSALLGHSWILNMFVPMSRVSLVSLPIVLPRVLQSCLPLETLMLALVAALKPDRQYIHSIFQIDYLIAVVLVVVHE